MTTRLISYCFLVLLGLSGCGDTTRETPTADLEVFKSPDCLCCGDWVAHMEEAGFSQQIQHPADLQQVKQQYGIAPRFQSCHTAVSEQGYVFEGHVPARYVQAFLADPPEDAIGLAVPGMPVGSPGMEMGQRFDPYQVVLLKKDGSAETYAAVNSPADQ